jgi:hypothetical protein
LPHICSLQFTDICVSSDGKTPDEIVKQVLAIAPVLPGQKAQAPAQPRVSVQSQAPVQPQAQAQPQVQAQPRQETVAAAPISAPAPQPQQFQQPQVQQTQTQHQPQQFQQYNPDSSSGGSSNLVDFGHAGGAAPQQPVQQHTSPLNTIGDLKEPLQPVIHRQDSVEGFDEEFHDADS